MDNEFGLGLRPHFLRLRGQGSHVPSSDFQSRMQTCVNMSLDSQCEGLNPRCTLGLFFGSDHFPKCFESGRGPNCSSSKGVFATLDRTDRVGESRERVGRLSLKRNPPAKASIFSPAAAAVRCSKPWSPSDHPRRVGRWTNSIGPTNRVSTPLFQPLSTTSQRFEPGRARTVPKLPAFRRFPQNSSGRSTASPQPSCLCRWLFRCQGALGR